MLSILAAVVLTGSAPAEPVLLGGTEVLLDAFPSGLPSGGTDGYLVVSPTLAWAPADGFSLTLGPTFRLLLLDDTTPPLRPEDYGHILRRQDWDSLSDYGQILRELHLGTDASPVQATAGAFEAWTLGDGHLISRYDNQTNANYHPAGLNLGAFVGVVHLEALVSDVLGARIFALAGALDPGALARVAPAHGAGGPVLGP